jgi:exosome complex component RRP4
MPFCQDIDAATRTAISSVSNIIRLLSAHFVPLTDTLLSEAYEWLLEQDGDAKDLLQDDFGNALVAAVSTRNSSL